jgi:RIO kinase 1
MPRHRQNDEHFRYDAYVPYDPDEDFLEEEYDIPVRQPKRPRFKLDREEAVGRLSEAGDDSRHGFNPTYMGSRHERQWILTYLGQFYEDHFILDVVRQVKGGKEATVYCCLAHPSTGVDWIAAKVYRPRAFRNLRNDAVYRKGREVIGEEGKEVRGRRERLAMQKKTDFGQKLRHMTWLANEFDTLRRLHAAGADVPKPFAQSENVILMEYVGDQKVNAPTLNQVSLEDREASILFDRLMHNVELMLAHDRIHADLSAFNVLYWNGEIKIIDFPQAVDPYVNPEAFPLFSRDVQRSCQYFARYGIGADAGKITRDLWDHYVLHQYSAIK